MTKALISAAQTPRRLTDDMMPQADTRSPGGPCLIRPPDYATRGPHGNLITVRLVRGSGSEHGSQEEMAEVGLKLSTDIFNQHVGPWTRFKVQYQAMRLMHLRWRLKVLNRKRETEWFESDAGQEAVKERAVHVRKFLAHEKHIVDQVEQEVPHDAEDRAARVEALVAKRLAPYKARLAAAFEPIDQELRSKLRANPDYKAMTEAAKDIVREIHRRRQIVQKDVIGVLKNTLGKYGSFKEAPAHIAKMVTASYQNPDMSRWSILADAFGFSAVAEFAAAATIITVGNVVAAHYGGNMMTGTLLAIPVGLWAAGSIVGDVGRAVRNLWRFLRGDSRSHFKGFVPLSNVEVKHPDCFNVSTGELEVEVEPRTPGFDFPIKIDKYHRASARGMVVVVPLTPEAQSELANLGVKQAPTLFNKHTDLWDRLKVQRKALLVLRLRKQLRRLNAKIKAIWYHSEDGQRASKEREPFLAAYERAKAALQSDGPAYERQLAELRAQIAAELEPIDAALQEKLETTHAGYQQTVAEAKRILQRLEASKATIEAEVAETLEEIADKYGELKSSRQLMARLVAAFFQKSDATAWSLIKDAMGVDILYRVALTALVISSAGAVYLSYGAHLPWWLSWVAPLAIWGAGMVAYDVVTAMRERTAKDDAGRKHRTQSEAPLADLNVIHPPQPAKPKSVAGRNGTQKKRPRTGSRRADRLLFLREVPPVRPPDPAEVIALGMEPEYPGDGSQADLLLEPSTNSILAKLRGVRPRLVWHEEEENSEPVVLQQPLLLSSFNGEPPGADMPQATVSADVPQEGLRMLPESMPEPSSQAKKGNVASWMLKKLPRGVRVGK